MQSRDENPEIAEGFCREDLERGLLREVAHRENSHLGSLSDDELDLSRRETLEKVQNGEDIWIFAYGSLIWNPLFPVLDRHRAAVFGFHRAFCLDSTVGRGSKEFPGLMLALDLGGACIGMALRMDHASMHEDLRLLWRREMLLGSYSPKWVKAVTQSGSVRALTFIANRKAQNYVGRLPCDVVAARIAVAKGLLGTNFDYLQKANESLAAYGIKDRYMLRLMASCLVAS